MRKPLIKLYRKLRLSVAGWQCHARMESGRVVQHKAMSRADALEWAACYGPECDVAVGRFGRLVVGRHAAVDATVDVAMFGYIRRGTGVLCLVDAQS